MQDKNIQKIIHDFKEGVADGLFNGNRNEKMNGKHYYKQGYDFGIYLYCEKIDDVEEIKEVKDAR